MFTLKTSTAGKKSHFENQEKPGKLQVHTPGSYSIIRRQTENVNLVDNYR